MSRIVIDGVHGAISPNDEEWDVIRSAPFQRLRHLKQLQLAYLVYPNATHTRFAHSLGVFHIMCRILAIVKNSNALNLDKEEEGNLRFAALLHDIGHYPYSHLLEGVDSVRLTEQIIYPGASVRTFERRDGLEPYPDHEDIGTDILRSQQELVSIFGADRAQRIGAYFSGKAIASQQLTKLIHSSLDMDRLDYLVRDSQATGVPYGAVDIDYLLNHIQVGSDGMIGISYKALPAAEHVLLARSFMFRTVCQHKTVYGFEEMTRQLLRRLRDRMTGSEPTYNLPRDGDEVREMVKGDRLLSFTDSFVDTIIAQASSDKDPLVSALASGILRRRPPVLLYEQRMFEEHQHAKRDKELFLMRCSKCIPTLAQKYRMEVGAFLVCTLKPIGFEKRSSSMGKDEAVAAAAEEETSEIIRVFEKNANKPVDIVDIPYSILHKVSAYSYYTNRLYVVLPASSDCDVKKMKNDVAEVFAGVG